MYRIKSEAVSDNMQALKCVRGGGREGGRRGRGREGEERGGRERGGGGDCR